MISVIIPLFNKEKTIANAIRSVLNQSFQNFEILVVDDGSTDDGPAVVRGIYDSRIRIISQQNFGVSIARNRGIEESKYDLIAFLDADDEWKQNYLITQIELVKKYPDCSVFATDYEMHNPNGNVTNTIINHLNIHEDDGLLMNYFEIASSSNPPLWTSAVVVKKSAIRSIGGFPLGIKSGEDLLTWARLAVRYKIAYCKEPLAVYNIEVYGVNERPKRVPEDIDIVGAELLKLKQAYHPNKIDNYISLWHKMRSSCYMRLGLRRSSIREAIKGLRFNPLNYKLYIYILINLLHIKLTS